MGLPRLNPLSLLCVADELEPWEHAGFAVSGRSAVSVGSMIIGSIVIELHGCDSGSGVTAWGFDGHPGGGSIDGIAVVEPMQHRPATVPHPNGDHPNGVVGIDHVVVMSGDVDRTVGALAAVGSEPSRRREVELGGVASQQVFCWSGNVILEIVGPIEPTADRPSTVWGITLVSDDLDATVAFLDDLCSPARPAVQPGRRIATVDRSAMGSSVRLAVMDRHVGTEKSDR